MSDDLSVEMNDVVAVWNRSQLNPTHIVRRYHRVGFLNDIDPSGRKHSPHKILAGEVRVLEDWVYQRLRRIAPASICDITPGYVGQAYGLVGDELHARFWTAPCICRQDVIPGQPRMTWCPLCNDTGRVVIT